MSLSPHTKNMIKEIKMNDICYEPNAGEMMSNKNYLFKYKVPTVVKNDDLLRGGYSAVIAVRFLRHSNGKIICDDLYIPNDKNLSGIWPNQKFVPTTYKIDSMEYYNNEKTDNRGNIFELTSRYMSEIQTLEPIFNNWVKMPN